jgi:hypothetical protein
MTDDLKNLAVELKRRGIPPQYFAEQKRRGMSADEIMAAWPPRTISNRVGSRRFRRRLVVAIYGSWVLIAAIVKLVSLTSPDWLKPFLGGFTVLLLMNAVISFVWLGRRNYINAPKLPDDELDERLVQIKNQAFRTAFKVLVPTALIAWPLSWVVLGLQPNDQGQLNALAIYSGVALLAATLPTAILAWQEPDPAEPDEALA